MISPAIHFSGTCLEAMKLYEKVFNGSDMEIAYYREAPENHGLIITDDMRNWVMHASMTIKETKFNFSDVSEDTVIGNAICFNVFMDSKEEVTKAYHLLAPEGKVVVELGPQFFSNMYASVIDKYGVKWQLIS